MIRLALSFILLCSTVFLPITANGVAPGGGTIPAPAIIQRIAFVGNSLTMHPPYPEKEWAGYWGMAASQPDRDYVHRVQLAIAARQGVVPEIMVLRHDIPWSPDGIYTAVAQFDPDLTIVQMGDNATDDLTTAAWDLAYNTIVPAVSGRVIILGVWRPNHQRDDIIDTIAQHYGATFLPLSDLHDAAAEAAPPCHPDVCWHPGDAGMQRIADRIVDAIYE